MLGDFNYSVKVEVEYRYKRDGYIMGVSPWLLVRNPTDGEVLEFPIDEDDFSGLDKGDTLPFKALRVRIEYLK